MEHALEIDLGTPKARSPIQKNFWIEPETFADKMEKHWEEELGNVSSEGLYKVWMQIAHFFRVHIINHDTPEATKWHILSPPTGTGKTQATMLYSAMLSDMPPENHPGVLIVTRLIADADILAEGINKYAKREVATTYHSENSLTLTEIKKYPVLIITHRAYEQALDHVERGDIRQTFDFFHERENGTKRKLVVVDEALDIVEHNQASLDGLRATLGHIPQYLRDKYPKSIGAISAVIGRLEQIHSKSRQEKSPKEIMLDREPVDIEEAPDLRKLIRDIAKRPIKTNSMTADKLKSLQSERRADIKRLKSLHYIFSAWNYYSQIGADHTINTARLLIPDQVKGAVVMDATASTNIVYDIFEKAKPVSPPKHTRRYQNFTLNVSRGHRVGKRYMEQKSDQLVQDFISEMGPKLEGKKALIVCHKSVEPVLTKYLPKGQCTAHWGAIDGSNQWKDCDTVVIYGIPYLPDTWSANVYMALQEPTSTEWLNGEQDRSYGNHTDIRKALSTSQLSTSIIQALNRIKVRKVINEQGDCGEAEGYILLPQGREGDEILNDIEEAMPGIVIMDWDYQYQKRKKSGSKVEEALLKFFENMPPDSSVTASTLKAELGISQGSLSDFRKKVLDRESEQAKRMSELGVRYEAVKEGRVYKGYFRKTH